MNAPGLGILGLQHAHRIRIACLGFASSRPLGTRERACAAGRLCPKPQANLTWGAVRPPCPFDPKHGLTHPIRISTHPPQQGAQGRLLFLAERGQNRAGTQRHPESGLLRNRLLGRRPLEDISGLRRLARRPARPLPSSSTCARWNAVSGGDGWADWVVSVGSLGRVAAAAGVSTAARSPAYHITLQTTTGAPCCGIFSIIGFVYLVRGLVPWG